MQHSLRRLLLLTTLLALGATAACASQPDIPASAAQEEKKRAYRSIEEDGDASSSQEGDKDSASASPVTSPGAQGGKSSMTDQLKASGPVAIVNSEPITAAEFEQEVQTLIASKQIPPHMQQQLPEAQLNQLKRQIVEQMVQRRLIEQKIEQTDFDISDAEIKEKLSEIEAEFATAAKAQGQNVSMRDMMKQQGMSDDELNERVYQAIALEKLMEKEGGFRPATAEEAKSFYEDNLEKFKQPEKVRARHILLEVKNPEEKAQWEKARAEIARLREEAVQSGADFAELAKKHSDDTSASRGGDLGFFAREEMIEEFSEVAFELEKGEVSEPVRTRYGWHIIKRVDYQPSQPIPFEKVEDNLTKQLTSKRFRDSLMKYVEQLRANADVELKLENIS